MKKLIPYTLILFAITACTERIDVKVNDTYTRLVVDGSVSTDTTVYTITLTKTADYFYNQPSPKVVDATVTLSDGDTTYALHETEPGISGKYSTGPGFFGRTGHDYTLHISLAEPINKLSDYQASCELVHVARLDSIGVEFRQDLGRNGIWVIKCYAQEPGNEVNYYMFNVYRNDTLLSDSINKVSVSDDKYINGSYINGVGVYYINNDDTRMRLHYRDKVTLQMSGITKEYYNFIMQVQSAGFNIPFFHGPPANVQGNVSNGAVGFFAAYSNTFASTIVNQIGK